MSKQEEQTQHAAEEMIRYLISESWLVALKRTVEELWPQQPIRPIRQAEPIFK